MNGQQLLEKLQAMTAEQRQLPVELETGCTNEGVFCDASSVEVCFMDDGVIDEDAEKKHNAIAIHASH